MQRNKINMNVKVSKVNNGKSKSQKNEINDIMSAY